MSIIEDLNSHEQWLDFLLYKQNSGNLTKGEEKTLISFIEEKRYKTYYELIKNNEFPTDYPRKIIINKEGTNKKRIVYSYEENENIILKFIAHKLYVYDCIFSENCYAFRRSYGVKDAVRRFKTDRSYSKKYCFKADISNYFNSINVSLLLDKMGFIRDDDADLFYLFEKILKEERVYVDGEIVCESHGAMAGTPCSPFFANVYLSDVDIWYKENNIPYFRYSDDILIFADSEEQLKELIDDFYVRLEEHKLTINTSKVTMTKPGECFEFLGMSYDNGAIDISSNTKRKLKAKIKRKADSLRRWQRSKKLTEDKAAIGFINAMNRKFFGGSDKLWDEDDFSWAKWFFPNITTDKSLQEIDDYMQQYIRYIITGRHYKGNYKITYEQMKSWGYISLVHEYYNWKKR